MKKAVKVLLTLFFAIIIIAIVSVPGFKNSIDRIVLFEEQHTGYGNCLLTSNISYVQPGGTENNGVYQLTFVNKDGFGEVTPEDLRLYLHNSQNINPDVVRTTFCFQDGTGLEVTNDQRENARYGWIDEQGTVTGDEKRIDMSSPLNTQIDGMSTFVRKYDDNKNLIYLFRIDKDGHGVADQFGEAGFNRLYDNQRHIIMENRIDGNRELICNSLGYVEFRRNYQGDDLIEEAYFDAKGNPVSRIDKGYAKIKMEYDSNHHCLSEKYYDSNDNLTRSNGGYAQTDYGYDVNGNVISQRYLDPQHHLVIGPFGYAEVQRQFDDQHMIQESYFGTDGKLAIQPAGHGSIRQNWDGDRLISRTYLGEDGSPINRIDGYAKAVWSVDETSVWNVHFEDKDGNEVPSEGINLAADIRFGDDGWSEWLYPTYNAFNSCFNIGYLNLGKKVAGDLYTSQVEVEYKNVTVTPGQSFLFWTQGSQDGQWFTDNAWDARMILLTEPPENGICSYTSTVAITETMTNVNFFGIGFRCDYWASGAFRVRAVKVEKGSNAGEWTPGI